MRFLELVNVQFMKSISTEMKVMSTFDLLVFFIIILKFEIKWSCLNHGHIGKIVCEHD